LNGIAGDVNQDGAVNSLDVTAFVAGWKTIGYVGDFAKYTHGDLNLDGRTNLTDAFLLHEALAAQGAAFPFEALNGLVPEPSSAALALLAMAIAVGRRTPGSANGAKT
jgi:hypothetical protein